MAGEVRCRSARCAGSELSGARGRERKAARDQSGVHRRRTVLGRAGVHPVGPGKIADASGEVPDDMLVVSLGVDLEIPKPIAFAWDERGRLWVCETRDYPHGVKPGGEGNDSIKICEDTDGDGRADKFTIFAEKLNLPMSLVFANGGVIVSQPPRLLFLKDTDGDDKADVREVIMEGGGIGDTNAQ